MKVKNKRILSLVLILALAAGLLPGAASAYRDNDYSLSGSGTEEAPYLIRSESDWDYFAAEALYYSEASREGLLYDDRTLYYKLDADITVSSPVTWEFNQYFDGGGHTLTFNAQTDQPYCAPFRKSTTGVFENLTVEGTITSSEQFAAGLLAEVLSAAFIGEQVEIRRCTVSVEIDSSVNGDGTHGGLVAKMAEGSPWMTVEDCVFNGQIKGENTTNCGGLVGWVPYHGTLTLTNCVYAPSGSADADAGGQTGSGTFYRSGGCLVPPTLTNCFYTRALGETQGTAVSAGVPEYLYGTAATLGETTYYAPVTVSGIGTAYAYSGTAIPVEPVLTFKGETLVKDRDYTVSIRKGGTSVDEIKEKGTYTVTVAGMGSCGGSNSYPVEVQDNVEVRTWAELKEALADTGSTLPIRLMGDLTPLSDPSNESSSVDGVLNVPTGKTAVLDLNGHSINAGKKYLDGDIDIFSVSGGGSLTVLDSANGGKITGGRGQAVRVSNGGTFVLENGEISGNGSGVANDGVFTMNGGKISGNSSDYYDGGGVANGGDFTMNGGEISGNTARNGGGLYVNRGAQRPTFTMNGGKIVNNTAQGNGGGVYVIRGEHLPSISPYDFYAANIRLNGGEISGNTADGCGGGVYLSAGGAEDYSAALTVSGAPKVTGNTDPEGASNIYLGCLNDVSCTLTVAGPLDDGAALGVTTQKEPARNAPVVFTNPLPGGAADVRELFSDKDYGLFLTEGGCAALSSSRLTAWEELKLAMANGGSITLTRNAVYDGAGIGSQALIVPAGKTVTLDLNGFTVDRRLSFSETAFDPVIIVAQGGVLTVKDSSGSQKGTITGGSDAGIMNNGRLTLLSGRITGNSGTTGGGICNSGTFYLEGGTITGNGAENGGGVWNSGTLTMRGGQIKGNSGGGADGGKGGGIYNAAGGVLDLSGGDISENSTDGSGGGVYIAGGTVSMRGGGITKNCAGSTMLIGDFRGGGVYLADGSFSVSGGAIEGNTAMGGSYSSGAGHDSTALGGGVYVAGGTLSVSGGARITGNTSVLEWRDVDTTVTDNVYLTEGRVIALGSEALRSTASIGVTTELKPTKGHPVDITAAGLANDALGCFIGDEAYAVVMSGSGAAQLNADATSYRITIGQMTGEGTVTAIAAAAEGVKVFLHPQPDVLRTLKTLTVTLDADGSPVPVDPEDNSFLMPAGDVTVTAEFTLAYYIDVRSAAGGTVAADQTHAAEGSRVRLTVTPVEGYVMESLTVKNEYTGDEIPVEDDNSFTMPAAYVIVEAAFREISVKYSVTTLPTQKGTVFADKAKAAPGETVTLTVTPEAGCALDVLTVLDAEGSEVTAADNSFAMPHSNVTVTAVFVELASSYSITVESAEHGTVKADRTLANPGDLITLTADPEQGYELDTLTVTYADGALLVSGNSFSMPESDVTVTAKFRASTEPEPLYTVTVRDAENGRVTADKARAEAGETVTLTVTPEDGYELDTLTVTDARGKAAAVTGFSFLMPESDVTVTAKFRACTEPAMPVDGYTVTVRDAENGRVTADKARAEAGETVTLTVTPADGYELDTLTVTGPGGGDVPVGGVRFNMPRGDVTVTAKFRACTEPAMPVDSYTVTVRDTKKGTVTADKARAEAGETVTLTVTPADGYELDALTVTGPDGGDVPIDDVRFNMPRGDVTVTATFRKTGRRDNYPDYGSYVPTTYYQVFLPSAAAEHGSIRVETERAAKGDTVRINLTPEPGYTVEKLTVTDKNGTTLPLTVYPDGSYSIQMPDSDVRVCAVFAPAAAAQRPFLDVKQDDWFCAAAYYCFDKGYFKGVTEDCFDPQGKMSRAMFTAVLYRIASEPAFGGDIGFRDVLSGYWYTDAIRWATNAGVVTDYGSVEFGLDTPITRAQIVLQLWRLNGAPKADLRVLEQFNDAGQIPPEAREAFAWAVSAGVMRGRDGGYLDPQGTATRAEVAQFVMNYDRKTI